MPAAPKAEEEAVVKTPAKRGRQSAAGGDQEASSKKTAKAAKADAKEQEAAEPDDKKPKKAAAPKRDKNTPLPRSITPAVPDTEQECRMLRILSLNVAGLRGILNNEAKSAVLRDLVEREKPDVMCLNETKLKEEDVEEAENKLKDLLPKEYATMHWASSTVKKGYSGVAVIVRTEGGTLDSDAVKSVSPGMGEAAAKDDIAQHEGRVLTVELPELVVVSVYVPNSGSELGRLSYRTDRSAEHCWDRSFGKYVKSLEADMKKPVVVIGDMNCCHRVQDMWNMHDRPDFPTDLAAKPVDEQYVGLKPLLKFAGLTPEERKSFPAMLDEAGLVDTFRALHPDASGVFSYFSQRVVQNRPMNRGLRLDYALASASLCGHLPHLPGGADEATVSDAAAKLPRVLDSYILDEDDLVADHAAIGCKVLLPPA